MSNEYIIWNDSYINLQPFIWFGGYFRHFESVEISNPVYLILRYIQSRSHSRWLIYFFFSNSKQPQWFAWGISFFWSHCEHGAIDRIETLTNTGKMMESMQFICILTKKHSKICMNEFIQFVFQTSDFRTIILISIQSVLNKKLKTSWKCTSIY